MGVGVVLAATPQVICLGGVVNPSGLELSVAICLWSTLLALIRTPDVSSNGLLVGVAGLSAAMLAAIRPPVSIAMLVIGFVAATTVLVLWIPAIGRSIFPWTSSDAEIVDPSSTPVATSTCVSDPRP
jgi:hypothetical protein